ncbi:MAG: TMF family protein [Deltaproteobacteria bacterium]|nr:TMF family protein [Deltaproteobacteria bacterium]
MFRDDLGAANARIAALEAKIAELEQERASMPAKAAKRIADLERQLEQARSKAARAEQTSKDRDKGKDKARDQPRPQPSGPPRPGTWGVAKTIGVVTLIVGALALYLWYAFHATLSAGEVKAAYWLPGERGPTLLLVIEARKKRSEGASTMARRLELRDGKTGQRLVRMGISRDYRLVGITPGGLWFATDGDSRSSGGLHRRDRQTLAVTVTEAAWQAQNPGLGRASYLGGVLHEPAAAFLLRSDDGRYHYLDPETLLAREAPPLQRQQPTGPLRSTTAEYPLSSGRLPDGAEVRFVGAERAGLRCAGVPSTETVLEPRLLHLGDGERVTPVGAEADGLLVVHKVSLSSRKVQLSLLPCQGPARWTVDLPGAVDGAARLDLPAGQVTFLVKNGSGHVLMALGLGDGALLWRQAL